MKTLERICSVIAFTCWASLCIAAAAGHMRIDTIDYCLAAGLLALLSFVNILR